MTQLEPGDAAPAFALEDQNGNVLRLEDLRGGKVLLYFYPKADTPGCTKQSCAVRDALEDIASLGMQAVGISPDPPAAQRRFDEKYGLGFPLLADPDHAVAEAYRVWGERSLYGRRFMGIIRSAFLIDEQGRIEAAWYGVRPGDTVPNVLENLSA